MLSLDHQNKMVDNQQAFHTLLHQETTCNQDSIRIRSHDDVEAKAITILPKKKMNTQ